MKGNVLYMEFPSKDIDRAQRFWSGILGWEFGTGLADTFDYRMAQVGQEAGVALTPADEPGHPNVYVETDDLDAAMARVQELGGETGDVSVIPDRIGTELPSLPMHGRFAACVDSEGNVFHLLQRDPQPN